MQPSSVLRISAAFLILTLSISSCSFGSDSNSSQQTKASTPAATVGTDGQLISIQSDNVAAAGYDANSKTMIVQFSNGYTYEYYGIAPELWNSFIAAQPHPWSQIGYPLLVQAGVPYKRVR
jgi:hypothetical protein